MRQQLTRRLDLKHGIRNANGIRWRVRFLAGY